MNCSLLVAAGVALCAIPSALHATVTETNTDRFLLVATEGGTESDGPRTTTGPDAGLWDVFDESFATQGGNGGSSGAYQTSNIANGFYSGNVDVWASAFGDGSDFATAYAQSHFAIDFNLSAGADYELEGWLNAFGEINGEISEALIRLVDLSDDSEVFAMEVTNDFVEFDELGSLAAGNYRLEVDALAIVNRIFEVGFGDSTATVDFTMTLTEVPAPGALAVLALGGLGTTRRRRH